MAKGASIYLRVLGVQLEIDQVMRCAPKRRAGKAGRSALTSARQQ